jgi:hypothetical protein
MKCEKCVDTGAIKVADQSEQKFCDCERGRQMQTLEQIKKWKDENIFAKMSDAEILHFLRYIS